MIIIDGTPVREVSEHPGVPKGVLYIWKAEHVKEFVATKAEGDQSPRAMVEELVELRKELAKAKRMNEILKKRWASSATPSDAFSIYTEAEKHVADCRNGCVL